LEDAGIKLDSVAADVLGVSGRAMLAGLVAGQRDPVVLAELAKGKLRAKLPQLRQALRGRFGEHHALLVGLSLEHLEHLERAIARLDARVDEVIAPFAVARDRLGDHHRGRQARRRDDHRRDRHRHGGVPHRRAPGLLGGPLPWQQRPPAASAAPAGPSRATVGLARCSPGCAWAAAHTRETYLAAQFWRLARRIGRKKAAGAVGHSILVIAWHLLSDDCDYHDLGGDWFVRRSDHDHRRTHLVKQLQALGYSVTLQPAA
jgi:transposase